MKRFQNVFIFLFLVIIGCKEKKETEYSAACTPDTIYSVISVINENAEFVTTVPGDWASDEIWCDETLNLFRTDTLNLDSTHVDSIRVVGFPNPIYNSHQGFGIYSGQPCALQLAYVDHENHVRARRSFMTQTGFNTYVSLEYPEINSQLTTGQYYRLYYACHAKNALFFYKGHGDIYFQQ